MTIVKVSAGACNFVTRVKASKNGRRNVKVELESACKAVTALNGELNSMGVLELKDILGKGVSNNRIFEAGARTLSHAGCPVLSAVIKAAEVELGLNIPSTTIIEFEPQQEE